MLTRLGPKNEPEARKRQRIEAMVAALPDVFAALREQEAAASAAAAAAAASATAAAVGGAGRGGADGGSPEAATAATAAEPAGPEDEAAALRGVVEAAVAQTMPDAVPGAAEHAGWQGDGRGWLMGLCSCCLVPGLGDMGSAHTQQPS